MKNGSSALISLDGLSLPAFQSILAHMPETSAFLKSGTFVKLDAGLLTSGQAIWGEILTGEPWYRNGCFGYTKPWRTIARTRVTTERDLCRSIKLFDDNSPHAVINIPLLLPKDPIRIWLSDGSMPLPTVISPSYLNNWNDISTYMPRRWRSAAQMFMAPKEVVATCLADEEVRMNCAQTIMQKSDLQFYLIRLSIFDRLSHLLGPSCIVDSDLVYAEPIQNFCTALDRWLSKVFHSIGQVTLVSSHSHIRCRGRLNLNELLQRGGFLRYAHAGTTGSMRFAAIAYDADESDDTKVESSEELLSYRRSNCQEKPIDCSITKAASSSEGGIWLNTKSNFQDGRVADSERKPLLTAIEDFLKHELQKGFGDTFKIWSADRSMQTDKADRSPLVPDLFVHVPAVELHNNADLSLGAFDRPRSVHHSEGFLWLSSPMSISGISPTEVVNSLQQ